MEQQYQLKEYGGLNLFEQAQMVAEDRGWWIRRIDKERKDRQEREKQQMGSVPRPRSPSRPSRPSISRRR
jgi:hypothetical protein